MLTKLSHKPTLCADLICIDRHVTSRNQSTFSREEEIGPWERGCITSEDIDDTDIKFLLSCSLIGDFRILSIGLELALNRGSCGGISLKRD